MVFFSSRISPFTSTVIFFDRSPLATAVVTAAMLRTWAVRLPAMQFTESVRSFQVPATPSTSAWPPSLPSVPTSRATRVTSEANDRSWSTIVLMVFFSSRISPFTSTVIFLRQVAVGDGRGHLGDVAHLAGQVAGHASSRSRSGPSTCRRRPSPWPGRRACLRCPPRGPRGSLPRRTSSKLVHHRVDGLGGAEELALQRPVVDLQGHRLGQVALGHGADHAGRFDGRVDQVVDQVVDRVDRLAPEPADVAEATAAG